jgi:hypothetical protein
MYHLIIWGKLVITLLNGYSHPEMWIPACTVHRFAEARMVEDR